MTEEANKDVTESTYPYVVVENSTNYKAVITVEYASAFCADDNDKTVQPMTYWTASSRGSCLVTKVSATLKGVNGQDVKATSYTSSGTGYSEWIVAAWKGGFVVTRRVT